MKNTLLTMLLLFAVAFLAKGQSTDTIITIKLPIRVVHDTLIIRDTIQLPPRVDTLRTERIVFICPTDSLPTGPKVDSIRFTTFAGTFKQFLIFLKENRKVGILDQSITLNEPIDINFDVNIVGYNNPIITIGKNYPLWVTNGNHIFKNLSMKGTIIAGNLHVINGGLGELRLLSTGIIKLDNSQVDYLGGGGSNNKFQLTLNNTAIKTVTLTNIHPDSKIFMRNKSTFTPLFSWKIPKGLIIIEK